MDFTNFDRHDAIVDYIEHVKRLVDEAESLVGVNGFEWLKEVFEAEQKFHKRQCEKIIAKMEEEHR